MKDETIKDILRGLREDVRETCGPEDWEADRLTEYLRGVADRIEAAEERERDTRRELAPGNAAAMREALLSVRKPIDYRGGDLARYTLPVIDAALKMPPEPVGNAAMMRMALEVLWDVIGQFSNNILDGQSQLVLSDMLIPAKNAYHHALAAPPRNCDVGTAEEQSERFHRYCRAHRNFFAECSESCPFTSAPDINHCQSGWAQMPYEAEKGGAE